MAKGSLLAEGSYQYSRRGENEGLEQWQISQMGHGGIIITAKAQFTGPSPYTRSYTYELDRAWSPVSLMMRLEQSGTSLITTQRLQGDKWVAHTEGPAVTNGDLTLDFPAGHQVDFESPLAKTVILLRTRLQVGQEKDVDIVLVDPHSLTPNAGQEHYRCLSEDKVTVLAGTFPAVKYEISLPKAENAGPSEITADHRGIVLSFAAQDEAAVLARYRRIERR